MGSPRARILAVLLFIAAAGTAHCAPANSPRSITIRRGMYDLEGNKDLSGLIATYGMPPDFDIAYERKTLHAVGGIVKVAGGFDAVTSAPADGYVGDVTPEEDDVYVLHTRSARPAKIQVEQILAGGDAIRLRFAFLPGGPAPLDPRDGKEGVVRYDHAFDLEGGKPLDGVIALAQAPQHDFVVSRKGEELQSVGGVQDLGAVPFTAVKAAPAKGYQDTVPLVDGHTYALRSRNGQTFRLAPVIRLLHDLGYLRFWYAPVPRSQGEAVIERVGNAPDASGAGPAAGSTAPADGADAAIRILPPAQWLASERGVPAGKLRVVGIANALAGIGSVTVNGLPARLTSQEGKDLVVVAAPAGPMRPVRFVADLPAGTRAAEIVATDRAGDKDRLTVTLNGAEPAPDPAGLSVPAGPITPVGRKWALLVGVDHYDDTNNINPLRYSVHDARAMYALLTDPARGGFPAADVTLLADDAPLKPTRANVIKYLNRIAGQAGENDLVVVFFSGHGYADDTNSYLLTSDTDVEALDATAVDHRLFTDALDRLKAKRVVVLLDSCHSGSVRRGGKDLSVLPVGYYQRLFAGSEGRVTLASCKGGQRSWEDTDAQQGAFTHFLVEALQGAADTDGDGVVTFQEAGRYVQEKVSQWAREHGREQDPVVQAESARGEIPLSVNPPAQQKHQHAERRAKLFTLLSPEEAEKAVRLYDADPAGLSAGQQRLRSYLESLIDGKISVATYREAAKAIGY